MTNPGEGRTIRQIVIAIRDEIRDTDLSPDRAAELKTKLGAIYGNILDQIRSTELTYNQIYLGLLKVHEKANRAKIEAESTPEYTSFREAKDVKAEVDKMISSLSSFLRAKEDEWRITK